MNIIKKLGGVPKVYKILKNSGWKYSITALRMQVFRHLLSREVCLILIDFMNKNNIPYTTNDFYNISEKDRQ